MNIQLQSNLLRLRLCGCQLACLMAVDLLCELSGTEEVQVGRMEIADLTGWSVREVTKQMQKLTKTGLLCKRVRNGVTPWYRVKPELYEPVPVPKEKLLAWRKLNPTLRSFLFYMTRHGVWNTDRQAKIWYDIYGKSIYQVGSADRVSNIILPERPWDRLENENEMEAAIKQAVEG